MISPQDLKRKSFAKTLKGYSVSEVDEYISFLITKYSEACNEYAELERKYNVALEKLDMAKSEENTISATIVNAQKMADVIVADAKEKASTIRDTVSDSCDKILSAYRTQVAAERDKLSKTEKAVSAFKNALYDAYKQHITLIDSIMPDEEETPYLSDDELEQKAVDIAKEKLESAEHADIDVPAIHPEDKKSDVAEKADDTKAN